MGIKKNVQQIKFSDFANVQNWPVFAVFWLFNLLLIKKGIKMSNMGYF